MLSSAAGANELLIYKYIDSHPVLWHCCSVGELDGEDGDWMVDVVESWRRRKSVMAWKRWEEEILNFDCLRRGALPTGLKYTTTSNKI
jgi:hypothetical protein